MLLRASATWLVAAAKTVVGFESIIKPSFPDMEEMIELHGDGYNWTNHEVHTDDGYILNVFRLVPEGGVPESFEPVFFMHGMGSNGSRFLDKITDGIDSLPIALAKSGYDVWLGNNRGNKFSSEHERLDWSLDEAAYWNFSFKEMGEFDLPAMLSMV